MKPARSELEQELSQQIILSKRLLVLGILLMIVGTYFCIQTRKYLASISHASSKIVDIEKEQHQNDKVYYPVFSFVDSAGTPHVIHTLNGKARPWSGSSQHYKVGDSVEVLYPAGDPESARLNNLFSVWGWTLAFGGIGLILAAVGIVLWYSALTYPVNDVTMRAAQLDEPD